MHTHSVRAPGSGQQRPKAQNYWLCHVLDSFVFSLPQRQLVAKHRNGRRHRQKNGGLRTGGADPDDDPRLVPGASAATISNDPPRYWWDTTGKHGPRDGIPHDTSVPGLGSLVGNAFLPPETETTSGTPVPSPSSPTGHRRSFAIRAPCCRCGESAAAGLL